jgi:hypothetical protein
MYMRPHDDPDSSEEPEGGEFQRVELLEASELSAPDSAVSIACSGNYLHMHRSQRECRTL